MFPSFSFFHDLDICRGLDLCKHYPSSKGAEQRGVEASRDYTSWFHVRSFDCALRASLRMTDTLASKRMTPIAAIRLRASEGKAARHKQAI